MPKNRPEMADDIYSKADTPQKKSKLPPELVGKSREEIAEYYERQQQILLNNARAIVSRQEPPKKDPPKEPEPEKIDIFGDADGTINRRIEQKINQASQTVTDRLMPNMVSSCKIIMKDRHADWPRWSAEVEEVMKKCPPQQQMDPDCWEIAYTNVRGRHVEDIARDAVEASKKPKNPVELPTPQGAASAKPAELDEDEKDIARRYDMTPAQYQDYKTRYETAMSQKAVNGVIPGVLPLTYDSRTPRKRQERKAS